MAPKVRRQTFDGYSPLQWWFGSQCAREVEEHRLGENRSSFERRLQFHTAAQTAFVRADAKKTLRMAQYARSRALRNPTVGQLVRYFRGRKGGVGGGRDRGLGGKMVLLGPARVLAVEQPTEVESQVAAVVCLAHGGSLIRAAPEHLVDCSSLDTSLFEAANPDFVLLGASWLRDLRKLRRTEYADLGNPPTESERLDARQYPDGREPQQYGIFSHHHQIQMFCLHLQLQNPNFHRILLEILSVPHLVSMLFGRLLPRSDSHQSAHDESENSSRMRNEPGSSCRDGQLIRVDAPDHAVIPGDVEMHGEEFEVGANDENPNFQRVPDQLSEEKSLVEPQSPQSSQPRLPHPRRRVTAQQFERNVRARQSTSSFSPVPSSEAALAFSAKKVGVEVSYPVTADMFENPENDWLATASSRARARVEVNIKKLSADESAQFRAAQDKEMDQWISNDVISVCQRADIPKERIMTMRFLHTWKVAEDTGETQAKARLVVKGFTDPGLTEIRSEPPTLSRLLRQLIFTALCVAWFSLKK